jgi:single-strand DNA-binding protein
MAGTLNKVMLIGNLGKDPEIMHFDNGGSLVKFPIATSETYTNREGQRVTNTEWHNVVINAKGLVDVAHKYLKKGHKADRYTTEIQVNQMTMLTSRAESEGMSSDHSGGYAQQPQAAAAPAAPMPAAPAMNNSQEEDDLPF